MTVLPPRATIRFSAISFTWGTVGLPGRDQPYKWRIAANANRLAGWLGPGSTYIRAQLSVSLAQKRRLSFRRHSGGAVSGEYDLQFARLLPAF